MRALSLVVVVLTLGSVAHAQPEAARSSALFSSPPEITRLPNGGLHHWRGVDQPDADDDHPREWRFVMSALKAIGFALFLGGLAVAAGYGARTVEADPGEDGEVSVGDRLASWFDVAGAPFCGGLAMMIGGALAARRADRREAPKEASGDGDRQSASAPKDAPLALLERMSEVLEPLDASALPGASSAIAEQLDDLLENPVNDFLELRESMVRQLGLETFAEMIGHFASMERGAARAWSAIVDEAWDEVGPSLDRARAALAKAKGVLEAAKKA